MSVRILTGDCRAVLATLPDASVQTCVTSPPYWGGLRDYGCDGQLGLEREPDAYVSTLVAVFREVRRVLTQDGVLWLNLGDVFAASGKGGGGTAGERAAWSSVRDRKGFRMPPPGYKMKDLSFVPFQVAVALREDGWYSRQTVIWGKPAAVEPGRLDRPATSHEYLFLFAKSEHYAARNPGEAWWFNTVWTIGSEAVAGHQAQMPPELARRCIACSTAPGDTVLDPFAGAGTTLMVADRLRRNAVGIELSPAYADLARERLRGDCPMFAEVA